MKIISIEGQPFEMGRQLGEETKDTIKEYLTSQRAEIETRLGMDWQDLRAISLGYLPHCNSHFPRLVKELEGIALGSGIDFNDLLALTCEEELMQHACTNLLVKTSSGFVLGHNEDWSASCEGSLIVIRAKPEGEPSFVNVAYPGQLPGFTIGGLNSAGIGFAGTSLYLFGKPMLGVPKSFIQRALLGCKNIMEARGILEKKIRTLPSYTTVVASDHALSCEATTSDEAIEEVSATLVHTNHLLHPKFADVAQDLCDYPSTFTRFARARQMIGAIRDVETLKSVLEDHQDSPDSICCHEGDAVTVASTVIDPAHLRMDVCIGNPCKKRWAEVRI